MERSTEIRWFSEGSLSSHLQDSFLKDSELVKPGEFSTRVDNYLLFDSSNVTGVKFREGNLEVKSWIENHQPSKHLSGHIQDWEKWSQPISNSGFEERAGEWISVQKSRAVRKFNREGQEFEPSQRADFGCQAELCELEVRDDKYHTFSLESWGGQPAERIALMEKVAIQLMSGINLPGGLLQFGNSMSYPEWLTRFRPAAP